MRRPLGSGIDWEAGRRSDIRAALLTLGLFTLVLTAPGLLPDRVFHYGDWTTYYLPLRAFLADAWRAGDLLPLWWSALLGGFPVAANPQFGLFYPPHWLLAVLPLGFGLSLLTWLHLLWGGLGMSVLLLHRGAARAPAILAGVVFAGAGPIVSASSALNVSLAMAWLPWVLHWSGRGIGPDGAAARRGAALALAAMLLAGGLEILLWTVLMLPFWIYASARAGREERPGAGAAPPWKQRIGPVAGGLLVIGGMALLLAAVQLLPAIELFGRSTRLEGISPSEAGRFLVTPGRSIALLLPWLNWDPGTMTSWVAVTGNVRAHYLPSLFIGATVLVLAGRGFGRAPRGERAVLASVGLLAFLFGLGSDLPVIGSAAALVPGSAYYRFDEKYLLLLVPVLAWFAAWGMQAMLERASARGDPVVPGSGRGWRLLPAAAAVCLLFAAGLLLAGPGRAAFLLRWSGQRLAPEGGAALPLFLRAQLLGLLLTAGVALLSGLLLRGRRQNRFSAGVAAAVVIALVGGELFAAGNRFFRTTSLSAMRSPRAPGRTLLARGAAGRAVRWAQADEEEGPVEIFDDPDRQLELYRTWLVPNLGPLQGIPTVDGASAIRLRSQAYAEFSWRSAGSATRVPFAGALGARYLLISTIEEAIEIEAVPGIVPLYPTASNPPDSTARVPPLAVLENTTALQPVQIVYDWRTAGDPGEAIVRLRTAGLRPDRQVVVSPGPARAARDTSTLPLPPPGGLPEEEPSWRVWVLRQTDEETLLRVTTPRPGLLVRSENPYPGWRATVDGRPAEIVSANAVLQAIPVPAGSHEVRFSYRPITLPVGALLSLVGLLWAFLPAIGRRLPPPARSRAEMRPPPAR